MESMDNYTQVNKELAEKYGERAFMYTEYPHKKFWSKKFDDTDYRTVLKNIDNNNSPILLYLHIPYCQQLCWFCTCHLWITNNYEKVKQYLELLICEIKLYHNFLEENSIVLNIQEIHLGGGSPTYLKKEEFIRLIQELKSIVNFKNIHEFSIEIDPRRINKEMLLFYHEMGVNRISFGIQDFDPKVQKAINRIQPAHLTSDLLTGDVRRYFHSINFDIICGLPNQTPESIRKTMESVVEMSPDRVCLNYLHISNNFAPHQKLLEKNSELPNLLERKSLFHVAQEVLLNGGYLRTGYDHFAKPNDGVALSMEKKTMAWNALGYTPGECTEVLGLGVHSYSNLNGINYSQNIFEELEYSKALKNKKFPIFRGYQLKKDDIIRRDVINSLRSYFNVNFCEIEQKHKIDFKKYFKNEIQRLYPFMDDGIVTLSEDIIAITELGKVFTDRVCQNFDSFIEQ